MKTVHLGVMHRKNDTRIFIKECHSLKEYGYSVTYITSDVYGDKSDYVENGVKVRFYAYDRKAYGTTKYIYKKIWARHKMSKQISRLIEEEAAEILHVHEYNIAFAVRYLKKKFPKLKIIYDVHEDSIGELLGKEKDNWIKRTMRLYSVKRDEHWLIKNASAVIAATDYIGKLCCDRNGVLEVVKNFPKLSDISCDNSDLCKRDNVICYVGGVTENRGITRIIRNSREINGKVIIGGSIEENYRKDLESNYAMLMSEKIEWRGQVSRDGVNQIYKESVLGLCLLLQDPNYINALPIKLFEYMAAGIPVVCSDFPLWRKIVEEAECGIAVDPYDDKSIIKVINMLLEDRQLAQNMGNNGRRGVLEKYNWATEEKKLLAVYDRVCHLDK